MTPDATGRRFVAVHVGLGIIASFGVMREPHAGWRWIMFAMTVVSLLVAIVAARDHRRRWQELEAERSAIDQLQGEKTRRE